VDSPLIRSADSEKTSVDYRTIRLGLISVAWAWWRWVPAGADLTITEIRLTIG